MSIKAYIKWEFHCHL